MSILQQIDDQLDCHEVVKGCVADIFRAFDNQLQENELSKLEIPNAVALAMAKLEAMVKLATMQYDGISLATEPFEKMGADPEPVPTTVDSWARGTVGTRKVVPEIEAFRKSIPDSHSNTPSVSSYRSNTGRSRITSGQKSRAASSGLGKTSEKDDKAGQIFDLEEDDLDKEYGGGSHSMSGTGQMFESLQKAKKKKDPSYFFQAQEGEEKGEFDLLQDQLTRAAKDMRGKAFVLDRYGNPVPVGRVNADALPPFTVSPASSIVEAGSGKVKSPRDQGKKLRVAGSRDIVYGGFEPNLSLAVTLGNINTIEKVNPGVAISSSNQRKAGDAIPEDPKHMSRKVYFMQAQASLSPQPSLTQDSASFGQRSPSQHSPQAGRSMASQFSELLPQNSSVASTNSKAKGRKPMGGTVKLNTDSIHSLSSMPDFDPMTGSRPVPVDEEQDPSRTGSASNPAQFSPQRLPQKPSMTQKRSIEQLRGGQGDKGIPRDRDLPQNTRNLSDRKHLPAPPLGFTTGHGLDKQRIMDLFSSNSADSLNSAWHQQWRN